MFKRILVALDRSKSSCRVLEEAIALAKPEAQLHLIMVIPPMDVGYPDPMYLSMEGMQGVWTTELYQSHMTSWRQQQQEIEQWLRSQIDYAHRQGIAAEYTCPEGAPGPTLCDVATHWNADLIMLGRRGRSGFSELLLGSVSNYVMHHAPCSVLTVQGLGQPDIVSTISQSSAVAF
ncbi:MAG: universal stress protein [Leptolyngbya sp. SIO3F4]|nr:universal stress protein [Leptolyngbya sp. SIO3F4]